MIKISVLSLAPNHHPDIERIFEYANEQFLNLKCTVTISYNKKNDTYRLCIKYTHPDLPSQNSFTTLDTKSQSDLDEGIFKVLSNHLLQLLCDHDYKRPEDRFGREIEDGRGVCAKCGLEHPKALHAGESKTISISSLGSDLGDVSAQLPWPDSCYLQGGDSGIVIAIKKGTSYRTSFCEAFPSIHGIKTFVRGEGKDILEAEKDCFSKYEKMLSCEAHEFSREVRGTLRRDGYAACIHCNLSSTVLPPLDVCIECSTPTNEKIGNIHYCTAHWLAQGFETILEHRLAEYKSSSMLSHITEEEIRFDLHLEMEMKAFWLNELGQEEFDKHWSELSTIKVYFSDALLRQYYGKRKISMSSGYPSPDNLVLIENINHYKSKKDVILGFLREEKPLKTSDLIIL